MKRMMVLASVILLTAALPASAGLVDVTVRFEPSAQTVNPGDDFCVNLVADITTPVVGWGLDVNLGTPNVLLPVGTPVIGSLWVPAWSPDGDGLAGLAFPDSVSGAGVLLATLTYHADAIGETDLLPGVTDGDGTEGFALDPTGLATVSFEPGHVSVIPEPSVCAVLAVSGLMGLAHRRRRREGRIRACYRR